MSTPAELLYRLSQYQEDLKTSAHIAAEEDSDAEDDLSDSSDTNPRADHNAGIRARHQEQQVAEESQANSDANGSQDPTKISDLAFRMAIPKTSKSANYPALLNTLHRKHAHVFAPSHGKKYLASQALVNVLQGKWKFSALEQHLNLLIHGDMTITRIFANFLSIAAPSIASPNKIKLVKQWLSTNQANTFNPENPSTPTTLAMQT